MPMVSLVLVRSYKMTNVTFIETENAAGETVEHAIIDHGNGEFTSMLKAYYDELKANEAKTV
jgi:hypothetical protein